MCWKSKSEDLHFLTTTLEYETLNQNKNQSNTKSHISIRDIIQLVHKNVVKEIQCDTLFVEEIESRSFFPKFLIKS